MKLTPTSLQHVTTHTNPPHEKSERRYLLTALEEPGEYALLIDNSNLETHTTCSRAAEYKLVWGKTGATKAALIFGGAIHEGLERWYKLGPATDQSREVILQSCKEHITHRFMGATFPYDEYRTPERAHDVMEQYAHTYKHEPFQVHYRGNTPLVEQAFCQYLGEFNIDEVVNYPKEELCGIANGERDSFFVKRIQVFWTGKIDLFVKQDGQIWVMDHKTTSIEGDTFWQNFELSHQMVGYTWAGRQMGMDVAGTIVNALTIRKPTKAAPFGVNDFARSKFAYSEERVKEWHQDVLALLEVFLSQLVKGYFPKMTSWCFGKYGKCVYHDVCKADTDVKRGIILQLPQYTEYDWSPLDVKPKLTTESSSTK